MSDIDLINKAINRDICVYNDLAAPNSFTHRLEVLLESILMDQYDYLDYILDVSYDYITERLGHEPTVPKKNNYIIYVGKFKNVIMDSY